MNVGEILVSKAVFLTNPRYRFAWCFKMINIKTYGVSIYNMASNYSVYMYFIIGSLCDEQRRHEDKFKNKNAKGKVSKTIGIP